MAKADFQTNMFPDFDELPEDKKVAALELVDERWLLMNEAGTQTYYDKPEIVQALQFWVDLSRKHGIHPPGVVEWGTTPKDFFERKAAMIWTTTGNLTNIPNNAKFDFGVAMLPAGSVSTGAGAFSGQTRITSTALVATASKRQAAALCSPMAALSQT